MKRIGMTAATMAAMVSGLPATGGSAAAQSYTPTMVYPNPDGDMNVVRRRGPCTDPWVTVALEIVNGRADPALCAPALYVNGRWNSFNELVHGVKQSMNSTGGNRTLRVLPVQGASVSMIGVFAVNPGGQSQLVAAGGGNLVAAGGGNLVAAGGGNMAKIVGNTLVAAGGGNLVAAGGGNLAPVATVRGAYQLQSGTSKVVAKLPGGGGIAF